MEQQYEWAVKTSVNVLTSDGDVESTAVRHGEPTSVELLARARFDAMVDTMHRRAAGTGWTPKYERITAVELVRRPVIAWTVHERIEA